MGSGFKNFTSTVLTAADLNNYCQTQSVMYFSSTGARDASVTAPVDGMTAYIGSADQFEGLYTYNGTNWRRGPGWNAPWGMVNATAGGTSGLGYVVVTTAQSGITTTTDLTDLTITFTTIVGRMYRVNAHCNFYSSVANDCATLLVRRDGATTTQATTAALGTASTNLRTAGLVRPTIGNAAASVTISLSAERTASSTGSITMHAGSLNPCTLVIEDIGPSGVPT